MINPLEQRQVFPDDDYDDGYRHGNYWYSPEAEITKWAIVAAIAFLFLLWFVGGYIHAKRRVKKGLRPLAYHRFLLPRSQRTRYESQPQNNFAFYRQDDPGYRMDAYVPPPPVYNAYHSAPPPGYAAPEGASKVAPSQDWIAPPPEPPPSQFAYSSPAPESSAAVHNSAGINSSAALNDSNPFEVEQGLMSSNPEKSKLGKTERLKKFVSKVPKLR